MCFCSQKNPFPKSLLTPSITQHQQDVYFPTPCCWLCRGWFNKLGEIDFAGFDASPWWGYLHGVHITVAGVSVRYSLGRLMHGPKWLPGGSAAASLLKMFDCSNLLCVLVITHQAVYRLQFVYDWVHSVMDRTAPERIGWINISNLRKKTTTFPEMCERQEEPVSKHELGHLVGPGQHL